jgi:hypothetical protein
MGLSNPVADDDFLAHIPSSAFELASIILFIAIVVTINRLRHRFSASGCLFLGVLMLLFTIAVSADLRFLIVQDLFASFFNSLLTPLRKLFESFHGGL